LPRIDVEVIEGSCDARPRSGARRGAQNTHAAWIRSKPWFAPRAAASFGVVGPRASDWSLDRIASPREEAAVGGASDLPVFDPAELRFQCQRSGNCCRRPGYVYFSRDDVDRAARYLGLGRGDFVRRHLRAEGGRFVLEVDHAGCRFFDGAGCTIHEAKPLQCRAWPFWPELVRSRSAWRGAAKGCPGIGEGAPISRDALRELLGLLAEAGIPEEAPELLALADEPGDRRDDHPREPRRGKV
jgi:Fe-S-cluster containining protein